MLQVATPSRTTLVQVAETDAHEGPVYAADEGALYFTTVRAGTVAIKRLDLADGVISVLREDANAANGMALDREGRLVVCEQGTLDTPARIARVDRVTGAAETVVDSWLGRPLNSPNDVVVRSDGTIWFTDPSYGWLQGFRPEPEHEDLVYRYDPASGRLRAVAYGFDKPNGLAFAPGERVLYVTDSGAIHAPGDYDGRRPRRVLAFDLGESWRPRLFADDVPGFPDGIKVDAIGRVYVSSSGGVLVFAPDGRLVGEIDLPGAVNFAFGPPGLLYITTDDAVWAAVLDPKGARP
jgi:gluconolactonase